MKVRTQCKYSERILEINKKRNVRGLVPLQDVWCEWSPSCKMRVVGKDVKSFVRRFVINQINIRDIRKYS